MWLACAVAIALIDYWGSRYDLNPDGVSYIDLARYAVADGPRGLVNGYWSPGYPALLSLVIRWAPDRWSITIPLFHAVNLVMLLLSLWVFLRALRPPPPTAGQPASGLAAFTVPFGAAAFLAIAIQCIGLGLLTPDIGVMLVVLVTVLCCLRLERTTNSWRLAAGFGLVLGVGYWMKAILLPLNGLLLVLLFLLPPRIPRARAKLALAGGIFVLTAAPLIAVVSARVGRLSMSEVGRLNYAWWINGVTPIIGWTGDSTGQYGTPIHPPRVLSAAPLTLEFATPIRATYPLWFDPSYWYAGVRPRVEPAAQWRVLRQGLKDVAGVLWTEGALVGGLLLLWFATARRSPRPERSNVHVVIAIWSVAAAVVYALVWVESRYFAGFVAAAVVVAWHHLAGRAARRGTFWIAACVIVAMLIPLAEFMQRTTGGYDPAVRPDYLADAARLRESGVAAGDRVAVVGDAYEAYATFIARATIVAQVMDSLEYWKLAEPARSELQARLAAVGVQAMVANNVTPAMGAEGWRILTRADSSSLGVLVLRPR